MMPTCVFKKAIKSVCLMGMLLSFSETSFSLEIKSVVAAGSGCKANEKIDVEATGTGIKVFFPALKTDKAQGKRMFRSNCNLSIALSGEEGKQFKVKTIKTEYETSGTSLDRLSLNFKVWFQGESKTVSIDHEIDTSKGDTARQTLTLPVQEEIWSPCKKESLINTGTSFVGKNQKGFSNEFSLTQTNGLTLEIDWRSCK
jgi:hypothetical protein